MSWNPLQDPIDYVKISTGSKPYLKHRTESRSPGIAEVVGLGSPRKWDERNGPGGLGATLIFMRAPLRHFSVKIRLYTVADWEAWYAWIAPIEIVPKVRAFAGQLPGSAPPQAQAYDFWHPFAVNAGIRSVVVDDILQAVEVEPTVWMHEIKLIEYRAWRSVGNAKPVASKPEAVDPVDQRILNNDAQIAKLSQDLGR